MRQTTPNLAAATATLVATNPSHRTPMYVTLNNQTGGTLYYGSAAVTNAAGASVGSVASTASGTVTLAPRDTLYVYSVAGSASGLTVGTSP